MTAKAHILQSTQWQVGILPETGASIAFGRVRHSGVWMDVMRPTPESEYSNSGNTSSFIMLPWCNRVKGGKLVYKDETYQLSVKNGGGNAMHGDVRDSKWAIESATETELKMVFVSENYENVNWPFKFTAKVAFRVEGADFIIDLSIKNDDTQPFPAGFGHHPYFVRPDGENTPQVEIPCEKYFNLVELLATEAPLPIIPDYDFRELRPLDDRHRDDALTGIQEGKPVRLVYPEWGIEVDMIASDIFKHWLIYAPQGRPFYAVEPMTNVNDGFNLYAQNIEGSGIFELQPGEEVGGTVTISYKQLD